MSKYMYRFNTLNSQHEALANLQSMRAHIFFSLKNYSLQKDAASRSIASAELISTRIQFETIQPLLQPNMSTQATKDAVNSYLVLYNIAEEVLVSDIGQSRYVLNDSTLANANQTSINSISRALDQTEQHIRIVQSQIDNIQSRLLIALTTIMILLMVFGLAAYIYLTKRLVAPFNALHHAFCTNNTSNEAVTLPQGLQGEMADVVSAVSLTYQNLDERADIAKIRHAFGREMRHCVDPDDMRATAANFLAHHFSAPSVAIFSYLEDEFTEQICVGFPALFEASSTQIQKLKTEKVAQSFVSKGQNALLTKNELSMTLHCVLYLPLIINEELVGVVVVALTGSISEGQRHCLNLLSDDLSIQLRLSENTQKQIEAENALAAHLELTLHIINAIPNPTYYRDTQGIFMGVNRAFLAFIDKFEVEVSDSHLNQVFDMQTASYLEAKSTQTIEKKEAHSFALSMENSLKEMRELVVYEAPFFDSLGQVGGVVGTFLDVTERNELERQMLKAKDEADKNAQVKGEFLANMSHEIRSPMNAIIGMAHLALNTELSVQQAGYVTKIDYAAKQLLKLINDILDFSKIEAGKIDIEHIPFQLDKVLDNVATIVGIKAQEKRLEFIFNVPTDLPVNYLGDPLRISQVLINLAGNAVKFTEQGCVSVSISMLGLEGDEAKLTFAVKDTGIGMSQAQQTKLFKSFSQADASTTRKYGGTGLGLTISQQLVKLLGGEIFVESEPNKGSEFYFTLPLTINNQATYLSQEAKKFSGKIACIIDDSEDARDILTEMLEGLGLTVTTFSSGSECIEYIQDAQPTYDILFVDWFMPNIDGLETATKLKSLEVQGHFVLVTAHGHDIALNDAQKNLFDSMLLKPLNPSNLVDCLQACFMANESAKTQPQEHIPDKRLEGIHVLVAEDQPVNQEIAVEILSFHGAQVSVANNGEIACQKIIEHEFNVVLMDMQMPVMDGVQATKIIRETISSDTLPILAMTANAMGPDIQTCLDAGMNGHVAKPIDVEGLIDSILQVVTQDLTRDQVPIETLDTHVQPQEENIELIGIDVVEGIRRAASNEEIYYKLLEKFVFEQIEEIINLKQAIEIGNYELALHILHAVKGAGANLSMTYLADLAQELEQQIKDDTINTQLLDDLLVHLRKTKQGVALIKSNKPSMNAGADYCSVSDFATALKEYDSKATELVEQLEVSDDLDVKTINELKVMVSRFQFAEAYRLLESATDKINS
ncbi:response regulator [Pseudoalteromonas sp. SMS1]|uniref:PAS domain-containing hybrid sensor histidine kinase/response regulator n=1 Tax=Pseudoalteromonas sp. SMS1 TaxID=2908894 RepID=UPI001F1E718B|nr:PAS domain-containing hybrid sensor histidine kinase/response regulator [Pseudoalteromonas sp. SMS1]MCF2858220.1 response regulator [Pseudoalteromonas sp. SMS1]